MASINLSNQNPLLLKTAQELALAIQKLPTSPRALIVGGFVRDTLLGIESKDLDMEVYGLAPAELEHLAKKMYPERVNAVGQSFGILKIRLDETHDLDVAIPRRESKIGKGHKDFKIEGDPSMTPEEAAKRRDFTVNSMMADPLTHELIDPFDGQTDLKNKIMRVTDPERFQDDPLRVYRALQFAARFDLTVEPTSFDLMKAMVARGDLTELSKERITEELRSLFLRAKRPSVGFELAKRLGIIERDYPELFALEATPQEHEWHPEGNVWIHTMMVTDEAARLARQPERAFSKEERLQAIIAAMCHDLGKPSTTHLGEKDGIPRIRSIGHEEAGAEVTKSLLRKWTFGEEVERAAIAVATQHLKPFMYFISKQKGQLDDDQYRNAVRKLIKKIQPTSWLVFLTASEADMRGRAFPDATTRPFEAGALFSQAVQELLEKEKNPFKPLVQGRDILERGMDPGPHIGDLIEQIENARDEGKIKTREEALAYLDILIQEK